MLQSATNGIFLSTDLHNSSVVISNDNYIVLLKFTKTITTITTMSI